MVKKWSAAAICMMLAAGPALAATVPADGGNADRSKQIEGAGSSTAPRQMPVLHEPKPAPRHPGTQPCTGLPPGALDCEPMSK